VVAAVVQQVQEAEKDMTTLGGGAAKAMADRSVSKAREAKLYGMAGSNTDLIGPAQSLWLWIIEWVDVLSVWVGPVRGVVMPRSAKEIEPLQAFFLFIFERERENFE
jgi:hypothetical protein